MTYREVPVPSAREAGALRRDAILAGHDMGTWLRNTDDPWIMNQSACAACDFYVWATDDGLVIRVYCVQWQPPYSIVACRNPLPDDQRLRLVGLPELFTSATSAAASG